MVQEALSNGQKVFRVIVVSLLMLGLGESIARAWLTSPSGQDWDEGLGWSWRPGAVVFNGSEGGVPFTVSSLGLNDDELTPVSELDGRIRLLGLGNSFMEALQVARSANYTSRVEQQLPWVDFVNAARSAMHAAHYTTVAERFRTLGHALTVVSVGQGDLTHLLQDDLDLRRDEAGTLINIRPPSEAKDRLKRAIAPVIDRSALATYMMRRFKPIFVAWLDRARRFGEPTPERTVGEIVEDRTPVAIERLAVVLSRLKRDGLVLVLDVPHLHYRADRQASRAAPAESRVYREAAARAGVWYLDTGPKLIAAYEETGQPGHGFANKEIGVGHYNEAGHRAIAEALAQWLTAHRVALQGAPR